MADLKVQQANPPYRPEPQNKILNNPISGDLLYHEESETGLIGSVLVGGNVTFRQAQAVVDTADDIFLLRLRYMWEAFESIEGQRIDIDYLTTIAALKQSKHLADVGGAGVVAQFSNGQFTHLNAISYAYTVRLYAIRRRGMAMADAIKSACVNTQMGIHVSMAQLAADFNMWMSELPNTTTMTAEQVTGELLNDLDNPAEVKPALMSGIKDYDNLIGGFVPGNVYLFAADTGQGKSSLVQNITENNPDKRIAYFSSEMPAKAVMGRLLKIKTGITQRMIREGILSDRQKTLAASTLKEISTRPLFIDYDENSALTPERLKARALQIKGAHGLDLLIVDHVTDMAAGKGYENLKLEEAQHHIAREIKLLASALNVPVLVVVQLNRSVRSAAESRPNRSHIRGSGRWEQLAAVITLLYREEVYNPATEFPNTAELIVDKVRDDGETGTVRVYCDKSRNRFMNAVTRTINLNGNVDGGPPVPSHDVDF